MKQTEIGKIPEDWEVKELGTICEVKSGKRLPKGHSLIESKTGNPYIRVRDLMDMSVKVNELLFLTDETYNKISRYIITKDDVYISIVGTIGLVGTIPEEIDGANLTENCARLTNLDGTIKEFITYYLNARAGQNQIRSLTVGSTQEKLALFRIKKIKIPFPNLKEQERIVWQIQAINNKIELLQKQNQTLEKIGQALFKHWFVDFEFPNDKGKPYKSSGGEMVDSELGKIPKGWKIGKFSDLLELNIGGDWGNEKGDNDLVPIISLRGTDIDKLKKIGFSEDAPIRWVKKGSIEKREITDCDILVGGSGLGPIGKSIYCHSSIKKLYPAKISYSNFCKRYTAKNNYEAIYCEIIISNLYHQGLLKQYFTGTSIPNLDGKSLLNHKILIPTNELLRSFYQIINIKFEYLFNVQIQNLSKIRDSLLPKLMSGKIRVPVEVRT